MELALCNPPGMYNFEALPRLLENLCANELRTVYISNTARVTKTIINYSKMNYKPFLLSYMLVIFLTSI
jgi:hypothetical protein